MARRDSREKRDRLWARYWAIRDAHGCGLWTPILWHLALGGDYSAMVALADTFDHSERMADRSAGQGCTAARTGADMNMPRSISRWRPSTAATAPGTDTGCGARAGSIPIS